MIDRHPDGGDGRPLPSYTHPHHHHHQRNDKQVAVQGVRNVGPEAEEVESAVGADEPAPEIRFLVEVRFIVYGAASVLCGMGVGVRVCVCTRVCFQSA